jgi:hypothetical protein
MSRTVSLTLRAAMNAQETGEIPVVLLTIAHPDLASNIWLSSDPTTTISYAPLIYGTTSRGITYTFLPFSTVLPDDKDDSPPAAKLVIDNIDRELIPLLRSTDYPATVKIEIVLASSPDFVEFFYPEMDLVAVDYDAGSVSLTLEINALLHEPFPAGTFSPDSFPGLF